MNKERRLTGDQREELARRAARAAIKLRMQLSVPSAASLCSVDAAENLGIELRFVDIPSMEGMYVKNSETETKSIILVSALRPAGRQASTAAHELGHHVFGHGTRIDQYIPDLDESSASCPDSEEEFLANAFAGFFLMPKSAVDQGFRVRAYAAEAPTARQVFEVSGWLGVGYATLIHHMRSSLKLINQNQAKALLLSQPKQLRREFLGKVSQADCFVVNEAWTGRPVDLQLGDVALVPSGCRTEGSGLAAGGVTPDGFQILVAVATGLGRIAAPTWASFTRIRPREFVGRSIFRHLESAGDDL